MSLARSIATVGGFTMLSRLTGFARDILTASFLGAGLVADAFFIAFKFPNLFRRLFAEGAFNAAFVPLLAHELEGEGKEKAQRFAEEAFAALGLVLLILVGLLEIFMPLAMHLFAPGFAATPEKFDLAVDLTRITFPYLLMISLVSLLSGVLNALSRFAVAAAAPVLLNLSLIAALLGLTEFLKTPGHALAWGTAAAGVLQLAWVWHACKRAGMPIRLARPSFTPRIRVLLKRILPGVAGAGLYQLNLLVDTILATLLIEGSVSFLYYADRVNQLPLGVVGTAIGTALLPTLSRHLRAGDGLAAENAQNRSVEFGLFISLPAAIGIMALSPEIVRVLFERGAFGPEATQATAGALSAFALGLPAFVLVKALTPAFFAREDTATPVKIAAFSMAANVALSLMLMIPLKHVGIALASSLSAWINVAVLSFVLRKRGWFLLDARLKTRAPRLLFAALLMGAAALPAGGLVAGDFLHKALGLAAAVLLGVAVFAATALALKAVRLSDLKRRGTS
jgi:putative peptidoglycan lipid II flippase